MWKLGISNSASRNLFEGKIKDMTVVILLQVELLKGYIATTLDNEINWKWLKLEKILSCDKLCLY